VTRQLIVFARAPQYGVVKTRLAAEIGAGAAWRAYREMSACILREVAGSRRWETQLAVTPTAFAGRARFWPRNVRRTAQTSGALGRRMAAVLSAGVGHGPVVIVGSDIPAMTRNHIGAAFDLLTRTDLVFGPAVDGGYWLIGARHGLPAAVLAHLFDRVRWSTGDALADTVGNVRRGLKVGFAATLRDVDSPADLAAWRSRA